MAESARLGLPAAATRRLVEGAGGELWVGLRGVGVVADLTSSMHGQVELIWQGASVPAAMAALGAEWYVRGDNVRALLPEEKQEEALEIIRREHLRLVSLTPLRATLEDYFLQKLKPHDSPVEVHA